jgi:hypothetical protein
MGQADLVASDIDDIGAPSLQADTPVGPHHSQIAGIKEAIFEECTRRCFIVKIPGRAAFGADAHSIDFAHWHRTIKAIDNFNEAAGNQTVPAMILWRLQKSESDGAALGRRDQVIHARRYALPGRMDLGLGHCVGADDEL